MFGNFLPLVRRVANPDAASYYVYLGKHHRKASVHDVGELKVAISKITVHQGYDSVTSDNDIAIMKVSEVRDAGFAKEV